VIPLPQYKLYAHNITIGVDYKDFDQTIGAGAGNGGDTTTPVEYLPLSFSYSASLPDEWGGVTQFSGGLNMSFRGVVSNEREFEVKRFKGRANYIYATAGVQRTQKLPRSMGLFVKVDGQISDQPLIDNEQYSAGGMESVRGYRETEALGDNALHGTVEVSFPDPFEKREIGKKVQMTPFLFYDIARLTLRDPLPGQDRSVTLSGTGAGIRGFITKHVEYEVDWAVVLNGTDRTDRHSQRVNFKVRGIL
jgi:hemolysin activation/secretion protein